MRTEGGIGLAANEKLLCYSADQWEAELRASLVRVLSVERRTYPNRPNQFQNHMTCFFQLRKNNDKKVVLNLENLLAQCVTFATECDLST